MKKNVIIVLLFIATIFMVYGYIQLSSNLELNNQTTGSKWNVGINSVSLLEKSDTTGDSFINHTNQTITFHVNFTKLGDFAKYKVLVKNAGNLDAKVENIVFFNKHNSDNSIVKFDIKNLEVGTIIPAKKDVLFYVDVAYQIESPSLPLTEDETIIIDFIQG